LQARFNARDAIKGLEVTSSDGHQGKCEGVDSDGVLQIQTPQGLVKINSSEVSVRPV
jgi:BirA family biotin operon repressor/biotin-[acetyl-CoA-carboxylase] ligase